MKCGEEDRLWCNSSQPQRIVTIVALFPVAAAISTGYTGTHEASNLNEQCGEVKEKCQTYRDTYNVLSRSAARARRASPNGTQHRIKASGVPSKDMFVKHILPHLHMVLKDRCVHIVIRDVVSHLVLEVIISAAPGRYTKICKYSSSYRLHIVAATIFSSWRWHHN